jgi:hypothetical protein
MRRFRWFRPPIVALSALTLAAGGGFAASNVLSGAGADPPSGTPAAPGLDGVASEFASVDPATASAEGTTPDPAGGPPWAVQVTRTHDGRTCAKPGQTQAGQVGTLRKDGKLVGTDPTQGAICVNLGKLTPDRPLALEQTTLYNDPQSGPDRTTFVWGLAAPGIVKLDVEAGTTPKRTVSVSRGHAFIVVYQGVPTADGLKILAHRADGTAVTYVGPTISPDIRERMLNPPSGSKLQDQLNEASRRQDDPTYHGG